jgi:cytochrome c553
MTDTCARCTQDRTIYARGLCIPCHSKCRRDGTLADYPRQTSTPDAFLEDYTVLVASGLRRDGVAARLGIKRPSLERRVQRLRKAGRDVTMVPV